MITSADIYAALFIMIVAAWATLAVGALCKVALQRVFSKAPPR